MEDEHGALDSGELFGRTITVFIERIESLATSFRPIAKTLYEKRRASRVEMAKLLRTHRRVLKSDPDALDPEVHDRLFRRRNLARRYLTSIRLWHESNIINLVSQFDVFLSRLLRASFSAKPELLNSSERNISFSDLVRFKTVEAAREQVVDREIESLLRDGRVAQFKWMTSRLGLKLEKEQSLWADFIEVYERRNLFVHTDGHVSHQYLHVCKEQGFQFADGIPRVGQYLDANAIYFAKAFAVTYEMGVKLSQFLWRKLAADSSADADSEIIDCSFELLLHRRYEVAERICDFGLGLPRLSTMGATLYLKINKAIARKERGDAKGCDQVLDSQDWSILEDKFKIAFAALRDDVPEVVRLMKKLGICDEIPRIAYRQWPLFKSVRSHDQFLSAFESIFGESISVVVDSVKEVKSNPAAV